jgi:hypothetical protein
MSNPDIVCGPTKLYHAPPPNAGLAEIVGMPCEAPKPTIYDLYREWQDPTGIARVASTSRFEAESWQPLGLKEKYQIQTFQPEMRLVAGTLRTLPAGAWRHLEQEIRSRMGRRRSRFCGQTASRRGRCTVRLVQPVEPACCYPRELFG